MINRVLIFCAVTVALASVGLANTVVTLGTYDVSANSSFFELSTNDSCSSPMAVKGCEASYYLPTIIAVTPGETLQLIESGSACYIGGTTAGCVNEPLGAVFDTSNTDLLSSTTQNRLPNQVASGLPNIQDTSFNAYYGNINTQIKDDFYVCGTVSMPDCTSLTGTTVVVPAGAKYLYVAALDSFYADNSGDLTITVNEILSDPPSVPEPATATLMLVGLAGMVAYQRRRKA
ncbi:MAG: PEP-CTERM sorting domain-containing protein [Terriglobales bacterium]